MTEARPPIPENLEAVAWTELQQLGAAYGIHGKKREIIAGLSELSPESPVPEAEPKVREPKARVGQIVTYRDKVNGQVYDARVSLVLDDRVGIVNLHVFVGKNRPRHKAAIGKGMTAGCWWPKESR